MHLLPYICEVMQVYYFSVICPLYTHATASYIITFRYTNENVICFCGNEVFGWAGVEMRWRPLMCVLTDANNSTDQTAFSVEFVQMMWLSLHGTINANSSICTVTRTRIYYMLHNNQTCCDEISEFFSVHCSSHTHFLGKCVCDAHIQSNHFWLEQIEMQIMSNFGVMFPDQNQYICLGNVGTMYIRYRDTLNTQINVWFCNI